MRKYILSVWGVLCLCLGVQAKVQQPIQNFYKSDYQLGAQNWEVKQQKNGIMYFANMNGLLSYDGNVWKSYEIPGVGNNLRSLCIDQAGNIYVGGFDEFGVFWAKDNGLQPYQSLSKNLPESDRCIGEIWNISINDQQVVFQSNSHLAIYSPQSGTKVYTTPSSIRYSTVCDQVQYLSSDTDGIYYMVGTQFIPLPNTEELQNQSVCYLKSLPDRSLLIVTECKGIYLYKEGKLKELDHPGNTYLQQNQAFCAQLYQYKLAVGTIQNGVVILDLNSGEYELVNIASGLQNNTVLGLTFDQEGNLWLGLDKGISYIKINSPFRSLFPVNNPYGSGYVSLKKGNILYLGTNQGLYATSYKNGKIGDIQMINGIQGQTYQLIDIDNCIFCCHHKGLFKIKGQAVEKIANIEGVWTVQRLRMNPNYLIAGCYKGFFLLHKKNGFWMFSHKIRGFEESSRMFEQDDSGAIWMSHGLKGVYCIRLNEDLESVQSVEFYGTNKGFPSNEHISAYKVQNEIVFCTEQGIYSYQAEKDRMELHPYLNQNLMGNVQYYYLKEDKERLWFVTKEAIGSALLQNNNQFLFHPGKSFSIPEALLYEYVNIAKLDDNHVLISNEDGFTVVNKTMLNQSQLYDVYIRGIYSLTPETQWQGAQYTKTQPKEVLKIPYQQNSLQFVYSTTSFSAYKNNQTLYSTRLENYSKEWSAPSNKQTCEYTNLPEGTYTFQVKTINRNSESSFTEYSFVILPPWYRTIWAYLGYLILLIGLILAFAQYVRYREHLLEKRKQKEMDQQNQLYEEESAKKEREIIHLKNEQLASDLAHKSSDLANSTMNIIRKNEALISLKNELNKLLANLPNTEENQVARKKIQRIILSINENIEHDDDWKKFEENFDHVHQNFLKRLGEKYKGLTMSDKRLCAYLKMNLVSKDIAPLLNISVRGVEISRYRLRKKLNLDRDTNLTEFLQNF